VGNDSLYGGIGNDLYIVDAAGDVVVDGGGTDSVQSTVDYTLSDASGVEWLSLSGVATLGGGNSLDNTVVGGAGSESLFGGIGNDSVFGGEGNNTFNGGVGSDTLVGESGNDYYIVDSGVDVVVDGGGTDSVQASANYTLTDASGVEWLMLSGSATLGGGNSLDNTIVGGVGSDSLFGGDGNDSVFGGNGNNMLNGGVGNDTLLGGSGNDLYIVDAVGDVVVDGGGTNSVQSSVDYTLSDASGMEWLILSGSATLGGGNSLDNTIVGGAGSDSLFGGDGNDSVFGGTGNNTLNGGVGNDILVGGSGNDYYVIDSFNDVITEALDGGTDSIEASITGYTLNGNAEVLILGGTVAEGRGNSLNNTLIGNSVTNTLYGGEGDDYYIIDSQYDVIIESLNGGNDTVYINFNGYIPHANVENIICGDGVDINVGNSSNNFLIGNSTDNTLDGGVGVDTLWGGSGNDYYIVDNTDDVIVESSGGTSGIDSVQVNVLYYSLSANMEVLTMGNKGVTGGGNSLANTLIGNSTYNFLFGGDGDDYLMGGGGPDTFNGGMGIDTMVGGSGNDRFIVDNLGDSLVGGGGADAIVVEINTSVYTLPSNFDILILGDSYTAGIVYGNSGNNTITGNSLANTLNGNGGVDSLAGELGDDYYLLDSISDMVVEDLGEGTDTIEFLIAGSSYTLGNNFERLILGAGAVNGVGNSLRNTLTGNSGDNSLSAAAGNDSLFGGDGNDVLLGCLAASSGGRAEIDTLTGEGGSDIFILGTTAGYFYDDGNAGNLGVVDYAYITDFVSGVDKLQLRGTSANYRLGTHPVFGLTEHQGLYRELGATDELIAIIQGSPISALDSTTVNWV
jgi:Ca2+-binding RTX toxin-like protein